VRNNPIHSDSAHTTCLASDMVFLVCLWSLRRRRPSLIVTRKGKSLPKTPPKPSPAQSLKAPHHPERDMQPKGEQASRRRTCMWKRFGGCF